MLFIGGGQDREQAPVAQDLLEIKSIGLWAAIEDDMPVLAVLWRVPVVSTLLSTSRWS